MNSAPETPGATKLASSLVVLFLPSVDRDSKPIDQDTWVGTTLELLGRRFGGATAFPKGRGVWRDDQRGGILVYDAPVIIHCYTNSEAIKAHYSELLAFLTSMGQTTNQGAIGFVVEQTYIEVAFPLSQGE